MSTLFVGGRVLTMAGSGADADALLVDDAGRVAAVGRRDDVQAGAGGSAEIVDIDGATVMPGLIDTHPHALHFGARERAVLDLSDCRDHAEIVARIRARAEITPAGEWIVCSPIGEPHYYVRRNWHDLAERHLPNRHVLDQATTDHPVHIEAWAPRTPNVCTFNTLGLRRCFITDHLPDRIDNIRLERDDRGSLTGVLWGNVNNYYCYDPWWIQVRSHLPGPASWELPNATCEELAVYNGRGVTTIFEGHNMSAGHIDVYRQLRSEGRLTTRVMAAMEVEGFAYPPWQPLTLSEYRSNLDLGGSMVELDDDMLHITGVTFGQAGPCGPGGIRMHAAYEGPFGEATTGMTFLSPDKLTAFVDFCLEAGVQANFVTSGYRDHDDVLQELATRQGIRQAAESTNWLIQHAILITEPQARAYAELGFGLTTCMGFSAAKGDLYGERIGEWVWADQVPLNRLLRSGLTVGCGTDWGPKDPWENMVLAQTHEFWGSGHRNDDDDHTVSRAEAVAMWTREAGRVLAWDGIGTLEPDSWADLIIVDRDPLTCDLDDLADTKVLQTRLAGKVVHDA